MQKIMIFGGPGSGKPTLARRLGALLDLPVVHMDQIYWLPGWVERPKSEVMQMAKTAADGDAWVLDGNHSRSMDYRAERADMLVFLDVSHTLRSWRVLMRTARGYGQTRPDMGQDCPERFDWEFLKFSWTYNRISRPARLAFAQRWADCKPVHILRRKADIEAFVSTLVADSTGRHAISG